MLTPQDDLIGHQLPTTFDHVVSSDPAWMERLWYTGHPSPAGDMVFDVGLGSHPNRNVMDGFAGITIGTKQYNFRVSRRARPNAVETVVGPLRIEVIAGLRHHRLTLAGNDSPLRFELDFHATMNPHEEEAHFRRRAGRVTEQMARAQQLGRYSGWIEVDGQRIELDGANWLGQRDHSWGIRAEMRTDESHPPVTFYPPFLVCLDHGRNSAIAACMCSSRNVRPGRRSMFPARKCCRPAAAPTPAASSTMWRTTSSLPRTRMDRRWRVRAST